ncbi:hypothetical protein QBC39DRAFT_384682 [Podospora conica]|nr:hypothetical protein QBC39DRAFT_384682 [Schizothecium conicum]
MASGQAQNQAGPPAPPPDPPLVSTEQDTTAMRIKRRASTPPPTLHDPPLDPPLDSTKQNIATRNKRRQLLMDRDPRLRPGQVLSLSQIQYSLASVGHQGLHQVMDFERDMAGKRRALHNAIKDKRDLEAKIATLNRLAEFHQLGQIADRLEKYEDAWAAREETFVRLRQEMDDAYVELRRASRARALHSMALCEEALERFE